MANLCYCSTCWPGGYRADGTEYRAVLAGHVMIRMHLDGAPVGDLVGLPVPGGERLPLLEAWPETPILPKPSFS